MFFNGNTMFFSFSKQNQTESSRNFVKNSVLDPKRAKLDRKSEHGHIHHVPKAPSEGETLQKNIPPFERQKNRFMKSKSYSWLHNLRNKQGNIHGKYSGNIIYIYIYIHMEYIRNWAGLTGLGWAGLGWAGSLTGWAWLTGLGWTGLG